MDSRYAVILANPAFISNELNLRIRYFGGDDGIRSRANCALGLPRSQTSTGSLLCTDSPSNPLLIVTNLISIFVTLVEMMGFEPMTPCLQGRCSPS